MPFRRGHSLRISRVFARVLLVALIPSILGREPIFEHDISEKTQRSVTPPIEVNTAARLPASVDAVEENVKTAAPDSLKADGLKIQTDSIFWKGGAELLPNPLYVAQLGRTGTREIRGGGWAAIDVANSRITNVELYRAENDELGRRVVEAKDLQGHLAMSPYRNGFPIVRGVRGLKPGRFEVFENPPCLVRAMVSQEDEDCEVEFHGEVFHYRFEAAQMNPNVSTEFPMGRVLFESDRGVWVEIASFNESFQPLGDPNRDGVPDFYAESVTTSDGASRESGYHVLLMSNRRSADEPIEYSSYTAPFRAK